MHMTDPMSSILWAVKICEKVLSLDHRRSQPERNHQSEKNYAKLHELSEQLLPALFLTKE